MRALLILALFAAALAQNAPVNPDSALCVGKDGNFHSCSGGANVPCLAVIAFSPTPTFDFSLCTQQTITLAGNVAPAIANPQDCEVTGGCTITFIQGSSAAYTVTWPGGVIGGFQLGGQTGKRNVQNYTSDGTNLIALSGGIINQ